MVLPIQSGLSPINFGISALNSARNAVQPEQAEQTPSFQPAINNIVPIAAEQGGISSLAALRGIVPPVGANVDAANEEAARPEPLPPVAPEIEIPVEESIDATLQEQTVTEINNTFNVELKLTQPPQTLLEGPDPDIAKEDAQAEERFVRREAGQEVAQENLETNAQRTEQFAEQVNERADRVEDVVVTRQAATASFNTSQADAAARLFAERAFELSRLEPQNRDVAVAQAASQGVRETVDVEV